MIIIILELLFAYLFMGIVVFYQATSMVDYLWDLFKNMDFAQDIVDSHGEKYLRRLFVISSILVWPNMLITYFRNRN